MALKMRNLFACIIISFLFIKCSSPISQLKEELINKTITAKTICLNPDLYNLILCEKQEKNSINYCAYLVNQQEFMKRQSYRFVNGQPIQLLTYHSEGPIYYTAEDLNNDSLFTNRYNFKKQRVLLTKDLELVDLGDTIKEYKIYPSEKLIIADRSNFKRTQLRDIECVIYEYE